MPDNLNPQRYRVPREDRSLLSIPDLESATELVEENRRLFSSCGLSLHGRLLSDLRSAARQSAIVAARQYAASVLNIAVPDTSLDSCVVSGHQPELFHVGVWAKNFTLAGIARRSHAVAVNLIIDNDTLASNSIRVPVGMFDQMRIERVPFDTSRSPLPWEEALVLDRRLFQDFGATVSGVLQDTWGLEPLLAKAWPSAIDALADSSRLSDAFTAMRAHVERSWGLSNLELPMSRLCETEPFLWFVSHLMMRLPEFHDIYNHVVADYRREHRLRNRMQPVPDLDRDQDWLEAPFWVWRNGDTERGRLFVRRVGSVVELRNREQIVATLPFSQHDSLDEAVKRLAELPAKGIRLRTRALTTTLFARVCLADLFVHGIGGAKYDAMTDRICERLFGLKAPSFLTVSATLYLPLGNPFTITETQLRDLDHRLRDLHYNPDRHLIDLPEAALLISEKNQLLSAAQSLRASKQLRGRLTRAQHLRLTEIRNKLRGLTETIRQELEDERATIKSQLATNALVRNREYSFGLYPESVLRQFLSPLANGPEVTAE